MKALQPGDLCVIIKPGPCGGPGCSINIGLFVTVKDGPSTVNAACQKCPRVATMRNMYFVSNGSGRQGWIERHRLKKIEPLTDDDTVTRREEIEA